MCQFPRCRHDSAMTYIAVEICRHHWSLLCEASEEDGQKERKLLGKIGLVRDEITREVINLDSSATGLETESDKPQAEVAG